MLVIGMPALGCSLSLLLGLSALEENPAIVFMWSFLWVEVERRCFESLRTFLQQCLILALL